MARTDTAEETTGVDLRFAPPLVGRGQAGLGVFPPETPRVSPPTACWGEPVTWLLTVVGSGGADRRYPASVPVSSVPGGTGNL